MESDLFAPKRKSATCCVTPCVAPEVPECSFHSFPPEPDIRSQWQQALSITEIRDGMKVCGGHFSSEDFFPTCAFKVRKLNIKRLKRTAVPSLFLPSNLRDDSLRILKVESLTSRLDCLENSEVPPVETLTESIVSDVTVKLEPLEEKDQYSIETFCCTTCGLISNTEASFLEHLGTHDNGDDQFFNLENEGDPLGEVLECDEIQDDDEVKSVSTDEALSADECPGSEEPVDELDGASNEETDEAFVKYLSSNNKSLENLVKGKKTHACIVCKRNFSNLKLHLTRLHARHPAVAYANKRHYSADKIRWWRRLYLVGDLRIKYRSDPVVRAFCHLKTRDAFDTFKQRRLAALDKRLQTYICDELNALQTAEDGPFDYNFFSKERLYQGDSSNLSLLQKHLPLRHKCVYCEFGTDSKLLAMAHFELHSKGKQFGCFFCQRYFESFDSAMSEHTSASTCPSISLVDFNMRCRHCWVFFSVRKDFEWHLMTGICRYKPLACRICRKKLFRKDFPGHWKSHHDVSERR